MDAAKFTGSIPENYDAGLGHHIFEGFARDLAARVAKNQPKSVLELASGTGILTQQLIKSLDRDAAIIASDLNEPMLEIAKTKIGDAKNITFEKIDATDLRFADDSFDIVTCQFGIMFFPDKGASFREVHRTLKPGGAYVLNVWGSWNGNPFARIAHEAGARLFPENPPGFYRVPFSYHDREEITSSVLDAGFSNVTIEDVNLVSKITSPSLFARGLVLGNPLYQEILDRGGDPHDLLQILTRELEEELGTQMPLHALVVTACKAES